MENQDTQENVVKSEGQDESVSATDKKMKNLFSVAILLLGLFLGSLFVDIAQLVTGSGFSQKVVKSVDALTAGGKTWVAYSDPIVRVNVITDSSCENCKPDQALIWLRRVMPTLVANKIDYNSEEGKSLVQKSGAISLPVFLFSEDIAKTDLFSQAEVLFTKQDNNQYLLNTEQLGIPAGKFLALPEIKDTDAQIGPKDAKVRIVEYADFQCPYCQLLHPVLKQMLSDYKDKVIFSYKEFPLNFHPQANNSALAAECANEQGKFFEYHDLLFAKQNDWSNTTGTQKFKTYAIQIGLKSAQFNQCLDSAKYQDKIDADIEEGRKFGISGTPGTFINDQFIGGAVSAEDIKKIIDEELAK